jgi:hypothetical protein
MKPHTLQEQKSALLGAWSLIPQDTVDRWSKGFQTKLQFWLVNQFPEKIVKASDQL